MVFLFVDMHALYGSILIAVYAIIIYGVTKKPEVANCHYEPANVE
jgi:hypothetical protein